MTTSLSQIVAETISNIEKQKTLPDKPASPWQHREEIKSEIRKAYQEQSLPLSETQLEEAYDAYLQENYGPKFPKENNPKYRKVLWLHTHWEILKYSLIGGTLAILLVCIAIPLQNQLSNALRKAQNDTTLHLIQNAAADIDKNAKALADYAKMLPKPPILPSYPDYLKTGLGNLAASEIGQAQTQLQTLAKTLLETKEQILASNQTPDEKLAALQNEDNLPKSQTDDLLEQIAQAKKTSALAIQTSQTISQIEVSHPTQFTKELETAKAAISLGTPDALAQASSQIAGITSQIQQEQQNNILNDRLERSLSLALAYAKDPKDKAEAAALGTEVQNALSAQDQKRTQKALNALENLVAILATPVTLEIAHGPGKKTGFWRDHHPEGTRLYYLVVEAKNNNGDPINFTITNEEDGSIASTSTWAEQVPENIFNQIKAEKQKYGNIQSTVFATKPQGTQKWEYNFPTAISAQNPHTGRITHW
jgi:hypothetical protein